MRRRFRNSLCTDYVGTRSDSSKLIEASMGILQTRLELLKYLFRFRYAFGVCSIVAGIADPFAEAAVLVMRSWHVRSALDSFYLLRGKGRLFFVGPCWRKKLSCIPLSFYVLFVFFDIRARWLLNNIPCQYSSYLVRAFLNSIRAIMKS